jgi:hypothetical protein
MAELQIKGLRQTLKELKEYEPNLFKELRRSMVQEAAPILRPIESQINSQVTTQLRSVRRTGMFHDGRTRWDGAKVSIKVGTGLKNLVFIEGKGRGGALGFEYAELAGVRRRPPRPVSKGWNESGPGWRSYIVNGQGDAFIRMLQRNIDQKPGRFLFVRVIRRRKEIEQSVSRVATKLNLQISRKLEQSIGN